MDNSLDRKKKSKDSLDDPLASSGNRVPRTIRNAPGSPKQDSDDLEGLTKKEAPRRTLSGDLDSSLRIGDRTWKNLETVHIGRYEDFGDSDSFMDDSFAGSSFASTQDSWVEGENEKAVAQFISLDDEPPPEKTSPSPRKTTPRRSFSKQKRQMPKKSDPLSAITEGENDNDSVES